MTDEPMPVPGVETGAGAGREPRAAHRLGDATPGGAAPPARDPRFLRGVERLPEEGQSPGTPLPMEGAAVEGPASQPPPHPGPEPSGDVLPFRRTAVKPRRKRSNPWLRFLRPLGSALLVVALPAFLAAWVLTSPRFALAEVQVAGTKRVDGDWVRERLEPLRGRNLLELPLAEVEAALAGHPWIEGVGIRKQLPDGLAVEVRERRPAALVPATGAASGDRQGAAPPLWLADAAGRPIVPAPSGAEEDFVVVLPAPERSATAGSLADAVPGALSVAADLARARPVWAAALEHVEALGAGEYRVVTAALPFPLLVREGEVEERSGWLESALPVLERRFGPLAAADLRFPGRLVLRPSGGEPLRRDSFSDATPAARHGGPPSPADDTRREVG